MLACWLFFERLSWRRAHTILNPIHKQHVCIFLLLTGCVNRVECFFKKPAGRDANDLKCVWKGLMLSFLIPTTFRSLGKIHRFWSFILCRDKSLGVIFREPWLFFQTTCDYMRKELDISLLMSVILISSDWINNYCVFESVIGRTCRQGG